MADHSRVETVCDSDQLLSIEMGQHTRFTEPIHFDEIDNEEFNTDILQCVEPVERSLKQLDNSFIFRFYLLMCLRNVSPFRSDKNELIELFQTDDSISADDIKLFEETYSSSKSIFFYTKYMFIYAKLNTALRKTDIFHLLPFRFVFQDICNQLDELMNQEADNQILTVYRGQKASQYEVADLFLAYCQKFTVMNSTFLSTSKNKNVALLWLNDSNSKPFDIDSSIILFKITVRKQDASIEFPFADISKISNHPHEEEVLFAPGQMFNIDHFDTIIENDTIIFLFEMSVDNKLKTSHAKLKPIWNTQKDPLHFLGTLLIQHQRLEEAKYLYNRLLSEYDDINQKFMCYRNLHHIAVSQNHMEEAEIIGQNMIQLKLGINQLSSNSNYTNMSKADSEQIFACVELNKKISAKMSFNRPIHELMFNMQSNELRNDFKQILNSTYQTVKAMMRNGIYDVAIILLEQMLNNPILIKNILCDPLFEPRCYILLGHCYHQLNLNDKASTNYGLALDFNIELPLVEYIEALIAFGKALEATNNFEKALYQYIEVAEIYASDLTISSPKERDVIEECIKRVISQLISID